MQHGPLRVATERSIGLEPSLRTLAREIASAHEMALDLQMTVAELMNGLGDVRRDVLFRLQDLDRLAQTLGDLATFTDAVAGAAPRGWQIDGHAAAGSLHLRDLAVRLATAGAPCLTVATDAAPEDDFLL